MVAERGGRMIDEIKLIEELREELRETDATYERKNNYEQSNGYIKGIIMAMEIIKGQPKVNEWISIKDRLPEEHDSMFAKWKNTKEWNGAMFEKISDDVNVTVEFKNGERKTMTMHTTDGKWRDEHGLIKKRVIAWQPLPSKYEG